MATVEQDAVIDAPRADVERRRSVRSTLRRWFDVTHRWLGFTCGAALVIAGLTGSLLAFYMEIERNFYPHMQIPDAHAQPSSFEAIYEHLEKLPTEEGGYWKIEVPPAGGPITSRYYTPVSDGLGTRMITLDPLTFMVMRDAHWSETFFTWIYDVHQKLLLGDHGKILMGVSALLMVPMLLSGLASWLLPKGPLAAKLHFKRPASAVRRTYDIHKLVGLVGLVMLLLVTATGGLISLPKQVHPVLDRVSPLKKEPDVVSVPSVGAQRLSVDDIIAIGQEHFPGSRVVWVRVPANATEPYDLQMRQAGAPMTRFPRTHLWLDQYTGRVLAVSDPHVDGAGDTVLNWLVPLHDGKAFGMFGRVLMAVVGVLPLVLFVTGFMRWSQKRSARARSAARSSIELSR